MKQILKSIKYLVLLIIASITFIHISCNDDNIQPSLESGYLSITFAHFNNNSPLVFDTMMYINDANNRYLVNEIQYFISDVTLTNTDGDKILLDEWEDIHYVDTDIESTFTYTLIDDIPCGEYNSISFTFGINEDKNQSLMFVNPPESFMFWPENLGGGYHYLKLNGKWLSADNEISPFNFHLGIGQIYFSYPDSIIGFVQNYFTVTPEINNFTIENDSTTTVELTMNVEKWFESPNVYNHDKWGGDIMQNQDAMKLAAENGHDVFTAKIK